MIKTRAKRDSNELLLAQIDEEMKPRDLWEVLLTFGTEHQNGCQIG